MLNKKIKPALNKFFCTRNGFFGLPQLKDGRTLVDATKNTLERYKVIVENYSRMDTNTRLISTIDDISNDLCILIDSATALYHLNNKKGFQEDCFYAINEVNNFFEKLNRDEKFYNKTLSLYFSDFMTGWDFMNLETDKVLYSNIEALSFFNRGKSDSSSRVEENISEILENLSAEYSSPRDFKFDFVISDEEINSLSSQILKTILQVFIKNSPETNKESGKSEYPNNTYNSDIDILPGLHRIRADYDLLNTIIKKSDNKDLTERAHRAISTIVGEKNLPKMVQILKYRLKYANQLGYKSFAEYQLQMQTLKMAPSKLIQVLKEMWKDLRPNLIEDLRNLVSDKNDGQLEPYMSYYELDACRSSFIDSQLKTLDEKTFTRRFITVGNVFNGLAMLTKSLFNLTLEPILDEDLITEEMVHESVLMAHLKDGEEILAKIYFDLFSREGKLKDVFSQFTVQGSKTLNTLNFNFRQNPVVVLAANFEVSDLDLLNMRLSFTDAKNLFHEYGHVLHSVLSSTDYQSLSGNRIPLDFAEVPSHLFEYFLYDFAFCKLWMVDKKLNEVIDRKLHGLFCLQSGMFANLDLQETLHNALFDLEIHAFENEGEITEDRLVGIHSRLLQDFHISSLFPLEDRSFEEFNRLLDTYRGRINAKNAVDKFYRKLGGDNVEEITHDDNFNVDLEKLMLKRSQPYLELKQQKEAGYQHDRTFTTIPHFKNYPSTYYTYIIGKVFSNLIWTDLFTKSQNDSNKKFNDIGTILRKEYLSRGYTESPIVLIKNMFNKNKELNKL